MRRFLIVVLLLLLAVPTFAKPGKRKFVNTRVEDVVSSLAKEMGCELHRPPWRKPIEDRVTVTLIDADPKEALRKFLYQRNMRYLARDKKLYINEVPAIPKDFREALLHSESGVLYSLNSALGKRPKSVGTVRGRGTLGKVVLSPKETRAAGRAMLKSYEQAFDRAKCFIPRHYLTLSHKGQSYEMLICFQCGLMELARGGKGAGRVYIGGDRGLNDILRAHKVPISK